MHNHYLSNILLFLLEVDPLLCSLLILLHQTFKLLLQLLGATQNLILREGKDSDESEQGYSSGLPVTVQTEVKLMGWGEKCDGSSLRKTQFRNVTHTQRYAADTPSCSSNLPSPCAVSPPLHPDCSQAEPQWRWCWRMFVACLAPLLLQQCDIQEIRFPPQNSEPNEHRHRLNRDKARKAIILIKIHCFIY